MFASMQKHPCAVLLCCTHMCSVETWLRLWANWDARFSSRQPKRQVTSSAILPLYKRLLVVVAGRGEGRGSWFNTEERSEGTVNGKKRKTTPEGREPKHSQKLKVEPGGSGNHSQSVRLAIPARVVMGTWGISPFMLKVRVGECADTQADQGVDGHPSSHLLTPEREIRPNMAWVTEDYCASKLILKKNNRICLFCHYTSAQQNAIARMRVSREPALWLNLNYMLLMVGETGAPGETPHSHRESILTQHRKACCSWGSNPLPSFCANHYATLSF